MMADKKLYVQKGKAVTSKRGILSEATEIFPGSDFPAKNKDALVEAGLIGYDKPDLRSKAEIDREREEKKLADKAKKAEEAKKAKEAKAKADAEAKAKADADKTSGGAKKK